MNSMLAELDLPPPLPPDEYRLTHQDAGAASIGAAISLIDAARRPILLVGQGTFTSRAHDTDAELAHLLQCPIIQTYPVSSYLEGLEACTFPCGFSPAGVAAMENADLVIAILTEIGEPVRSGVGEHWAKGKVERKWIYIERDPIAMRVNRRIDVPLLGNLRDVVPQLVVALKGSPRERPPEMDTWERMHADYRAKYTASAPTGTPPMHPAIFTIEVTRAMPRDAVLVRDGGATNICTWTYSQVMPRDSIWNQNFGHLGTDLPYAIGARLAVEEDRRVVLITGDSAFLFHISGLETAVRKKLPVICVVACDYAWGLEVRGYRGVLGPASPETEAHWGKQVRLDKIAQGFGAHGEYVEQSADIAPAMARALASGKPAVIHVPVDADANARDVPGHEEYSTWYTDFF